MEREEGIGMKPFLLHYYITNRCNSRCVFCSIWQETPKVDACTRDVLRNLKHAKDAGCRFVDFTGGEPLLHKDLPTFLYEAKKLGFITSITTNCLLFPSKAASLVGQIDLLHFSIDADSAELHNQMRGVASFSSVIESIDIALKHKLIPDLLFTYTDQNIDHIEKVYELAREKKLLLILDPVFDTSGPDKVHQTTHEKARVFSRRKGVYLNEAHHVLRRQGGNHIRKPLCRAVESTIVILPQNRIALPCFHHRSRTPDIGENLHDLLNAEERKGALAKQGKYSFCEGCHINCYFDPSYVLMRNQMFFRSMLAKISYSWRKYIVYRYPLPVFSRNSH